MAFRHISLIFGLILIEIIILSTVKSSTIYTKLNYNVSNGNHFIPLHYDVKIKFDIDRNVFYGKCNINIQINRPTKSITIKSSNIFGIIKIDLIYNNPNQTTSTKLPITVGVQKFSFMSESYVHLDFIQSSIDDFLFPGIYILNMVYVHILDDEDFSESSYTNKEEM